MSQLTHLIVKHCYSYKIFQICLFTINLLCVLFITPGKSQILVHCLIEIEKQKPKNKIHYPLFNNKRDVHSMNDGTTIKRNI